MPDYAPQPDIQDILAEEQLIDEQQTNDATNSDPNNPTPPADLGEGEQQPEGGNEPAPTDPNAPKPSTPGEAEEVTNKPVEPETPTTFEEKDLFIEVQGFASADATEKTTLKVRSLDDLPADFQFENNQEMLKFNQDFAKLQDDQKRQQSDKTTFEETKSREEATTRTLERWDKEISSLRESGRIPEVKARANAKAEDKANDPGLKREAEVYGYIVKENQRREAAGIPPLASFEDALDKLEMQEYRAAKEAEDRKGVAVKKKQSGYIGKSQPGTPPATVGGGYVKGSGMSPSDFLNDYGDEE